MSSNYLERQRKNEELRNSGPQLDGEHKKSPSDQWSAFSDSVLSSRHLSPDEIEHRGSNGILTMANLCKMYVGIAFMSTGKSIS